MDTYHRQKKRIQSFRNPKPKPAKPSKKPAKSAANQNPPDDYDANEKLLREFDLNMAYGPCVGISRIDRWNRAKAFGLNPPQEVESLLKSNQIRQDCLWPNLK